MKQKPTDEMLSDLMKSNRIEDYLKANEANMTFESLTVQLNRLLKEYGLNKKDVIKASDLNGIYAYQIFAGTRMPSRDKLLCICAAMKIPVETTQRLLKTTGYAPLYAKDKRDSIIIFMLNKKAAVLDINLELESAGLPPLGAKK